MPRTLQGAFAALIFLLPAAHAQPGFSHLEMDVLDADDQPSNAIQGLEKKRRQLQSRQPGPAPDVPRSIDDPLATRVMPEPAPFDAFAGAEAERQESEREEKDGHHKGKGG
jgi:hypothetical protein